jgi:signal transduction histidine kinase
MTAALARLAPTAWLRSPRPTARLRLTLLYGALFVLSGAALLAVTYLLVDRATAFIATPGREAAFFGIFAGLHPGPAGQHAAKVALPGGTRKGVLGQLARWHAYEMDELLVRSGVALGITAVLSVALGWLVAGRVLRPVRTISAAAQQIGASNLHDRLSLDGPDDEFRELAATLDDLLERLAGAFESQRRFVANASHELRTPLTLDRALLERALAKPEPSQAFWRTTCERLLASSQQQDRLIDALLTLARSEAGAARHEEFELSEVIDNVLLGPDLDLGDAGPQIATKIDPAVVTGDSRLVQRLVRNLVDNAVRYNRPSGHVDITATTSSGHAVLVVSNTGPAVPEAEIERLFQPFQRLAPTRGSRADGTGLGLSIVKAIADAHDGRVTALPLPDGGLTVQVRFPPPAGGAGPRCPASPRAVGSVRRDQPSSHAGCDQDRDLYRVGIRSGSPAAAGQRPPVAGEPVSAMDDCVCGR